MAHLLNISICPSTPLEVDLPGSGVTVAETRTIQVGRTAYDDETDGLLVRLEYEDGDGERVGAIQLSLARESAAKIGAFLLANSVMEPGDVQPFEPFADEDPDDD